MLVLRFTQDCAIVDCPDVLAFVRRVNADPIKNGGGYKTHVIDLDTNEMVWQSNESYRYGNKNVLAVL